MTIQWLAYCVCLPVEKNIYWHIKRTCIFDFKLLLHHRCLISLCIHSFLVGKSNKYLNHIQVKWLTCISPLVVVLIIDKSLIWIIFIQISTACDNICGYLSLAQFVAAVLVVQGWVDFVSMGCEGRQVLMCCAMKVN